MAIKAERDKGVEREQGPAGGPVFVIRNEQLYQAGRLCLIRLVKTGDCKVKGNKIE